MTYEWRCLTCKKTFEVLRSISDRSTPPQPGEACKHSEFERVISASMVQSRKARDSQYPFKMRTQEGMQTFTSHAQQREWMDSNGYVFTNEAYGEETWSDSQKSSVEHPYVDTPPDGVRDLTGDAFFTQDVDNFNLGAEEASP